VEEGRAGDILLFQTKSNVLSGLTRSVTASRWDHIGLLVGDERQLYVMEALANGGVQTSRFSQFYNCGWYKQYSSIAIRRLVGPMSQDMRKQLTDFINRAMGKKYKVKAFQMVTQWLGASGGGQYETDKTHFCCSELVAAAYKDLGILRPDIDAVVYLPGSFGADKQLMLLEGFRLSEEMEVRFETKEND